MKCSQVLLVAGLLALPWLSASCGGSAKTDPPGAAGAAGTAGAGSAGAPPAADSCAVAADCAWGEIQDDLLKASDCPCLYGCGYLAQNTATQERRAAQYDNLCNPERDGRGNACGIDDCAPPGVLTCVSGRCRPLNTMR